MMRAKGANSFWTLGPANRERRQAGVQGDNGSVPGLTHNLRVKSGPSRVDQTAEWGKVSPISLRGDGLEAAPVAASTTTDTSDPTSVLVVLREIPRIAPPEQSSLPCRLSHPWLRFWPRGCRLRACQIFAGGSHLIVGTVICIEKPNLYQLRLSLARLAV